MEYEFGIEICCKCKSYMSSQMECLVEFVEEKIVGVVVCRHGFGVKVHIIWYTYSPL
jgi:hypothetical protein